MSLDDKFKIFMRLYEAKKIQLRFGRSSFAIMFSDEAKKEIPSDEKEEKEFRNFVSSLLNGLRQKIIEGKLDQEYSKYEKYIDDLLRHDSEIKDDIITRIKSNVNICHDISYEILTKRNKNLDVECFSALINLNLEKPHPRKDILEPINFELSVKDLKLFQSVLEDAIEDINSLVEDCQKR